MIRPKRKKYKPQRQLPQAHKRSFCEKRATLTFITNARIHIGPKQYQNTKSLIIGTRSNTTLSNINSLIINLRKTLNQVYLVSHHRGLIVVSGETVQNFIGIGGRMFYAFSPWSNGFLTNFVTLLRHAITDKQLQRYPKRHLPISALNLKKAPQLPSYHIALQQQHWACNEAGSLLLPQTINASQNYTHQFYHPQATLCINHNATLPYGVLTFLIREAIVMARTQEKLFFILEKPKFIKRPIRKAQPTSQRKNLGKRKGR